MTYGYIRVSTEHQSVIRQKDNITHKYGDIPLFYDKCTGTTQNRPQWQRLMSVVMAGDTIVFDEVSRMSRNADEGIADYMSLYNKGINLVFANDPHANTEVFKSTVQIAAIGNEVDYVIEGINKYIMAIAEKQIRIAFEKAESEVEYLQRRTREGMRSKGATNIIDTEGNVMCYGSIALSRMGNKYHRPSESICMQVILDKSQDYNGTMNDVHVLLECNNALKRKGIKEISRPTYYRYKSTIPV